MAKIKFNIKDVLISTGELSEEIKISDNKIVVYESCPKGETIGSNEAKHKEFNKKIFFNIAKNLNTRGYNLSNFDKTIPNYLGTNITTSLSLGFLRYVAAKQDKSIYQYISDQFGTYPKVPSIICNILNGGKHAGNNLEICEFMIIPRGKDIKEDILIASQVYNDLRGNISQRLGVHHTMVGREGGFSPILDDVIKAINLVKEAINKRNKGKCNIAIDVAANNFSVKKKDRFYYKIKGKLIDTDGLIEFYSFLLKEFPEINYLEDPFHEEDKRGWKLIMDKFGHKNMIVADDLTVTNKEHIRENLGLFNSIILKTNQVGTFSGLLAAYRYCKRKGIKVIISQRSGETDSNIISHIATGLRSELIKAGAPARERIVKYNELLRLSEEIENE